MPTIYRIISYTGPQEWLEETFANNSIKDKKVFPNGATITAKIFDPNNLDHVKALQELADSLQFCR